MTALTIQETMKLLSHIRFGHGELGVSTDVILSSGVRFYDAIPRNEARLLNE
jgi:hypothetical protein